MDNLENPIYRFGPFDLDGRRLALYRDGRTANLAAQPVRVLRYLMERPGRLVTRDELQQEIWGREVVGFDDRLNTCIAKIRLTLGDTAGRPTYVETIRGRGYSFIATPEVVTSVRASPVTSDSRDPDSRDSLAAHVLRRRNLRLRIPHLVETRLAATLAAVGGTAAALLAIQAVAASRPDYAALPEPDELPRLAVLTFQTYGDGTRDEFAAGASDAIATRLAHQEWVDVIARVPAESQRPIDAMWAEEREADYLLSGTLELTATGDRPAARFRPVLVEARRGTQIWAGEYDLPAADLYDLESTIGDLVARELRGVLPHRPESDLVPRTTGDTEAWELYQEAIRVLRRPGSAARLQGVDLLETALDLDPDFGLAQAQLSVALSTEFWADRSMRRLAQASEAADKALELAPDLPQTQLAVGHYHLRTRDYETALSALAEAESRMPDDPQVLTAIGWTHQRAGNWDAAQEYLERAFSEDPHSSLVARTIAVGHWRNREFELADRYLSLSAAIDPEIGSTYVVRMLVALARGDAPGHVLDIETESATLEGHSLVRLVFSQRQIARWLGSAALAWQARRHRGSGLEGDSVSVADLRHEAESFLSATSASSASGFYSLFVGRWYASRGENTRARQLFETARDAFERRLTEDSVGWNGIPYEPTYLASAYAALGQRGRARRQAHQVLEAFPADKDAMASAYIRVIIAEVLAAIGDSEAALDLIEEQLGRPSTITVATLRTDPVWEPLQGNPRFEALLRKH
ncbi:MAG: winged helix-turn-helix domain-containing protein [Gemmatimonadota bacterium]